MSKIKNITPKFEKGEMIIYKSATGPEIQVRLERETIWLDAHKIAEVFNVDRSVILKHIQNIYKSGELSEKATCAKIAQVAADGKIRKMDIYNLDAVVSVGYRVNSQKATQFRIWATRTLRNYLIKGYAVNEKRLLSVQGRFNELRNAVSFLQEKSKHQLLAGQEQEILNLLSDYSKTLSVLEQYDTGRLVRPKGQKVRFKLEYNDCLKIVTEIKPELMSRGEAGDLFGVAIADAFEGIVKNLYQTFGGKELYKTIEEKAAHLLYFIIKDHPFSDGNKRIASFLFVYFLDKNSFLYKETGERKINDNALVALALLIAVSDPKEKDVMIKLIINLIS